MDQQSLLRQIAALQQQVESLETAQSQLQAEAHTLRQHLEQERSERLAEQQQFVAAQQQQAESTQSANERFRSLFSRQQWTEEILRASEGRARARAEELEAIMQITPVAIWIAHDPQCHHITANQTAYQLMRVEPGSNATATPLDGTSPLNFRQRRNGQDIPPQDLPMQRAARTGQVIKDELEFVFEDGTVRFIYGSAVPLRDEAGKVRGVIGAFVDITDRKQAEQEREQLLARESAARQEAETANRIKDEFLAVLSHELRSPLNPILGWTKLLLTRSFDAGATRNALETIERNARLQTQLIEDLLDVSRILRGKMVLQTVPVDLKTVIQSALETVRLAAESKDIQIQTILAPIAGRVIGDPNRLQQAVWNLLSNAVKFTPPGGRVEVRLSSVTGDWSLAEHQSPITNDQGQMTNDQSPVTTYAHITVTDTGKGISPDFLPHVFDYFRQEDGKTTRQFGGLGLGLAIVQHLIQQHGGTIHADSLGEGMGATFTICLPLTESIKESFTEQKIIEPVIDLNQLRILAIDDEADMRKLIQVTLQEYGAEVLVVSSAAEALRLLDEFKPDVLISDIGMPSMDGYELIRRVKSRLEAQRSNPANERLDSPNLPLQNGRSRGRGLRAIALTAYAGESDRQKSLAAGFDLHLAKPVDSEELVKAVMQVMQSEQSWHPSAYSS